MKRIIASAGLIAVGASSLHAAYAPGLTPLETSKPWSISAAVAGFYDSNYAQAPYGSVSGSSKDSFGISVTPTVSINMPMDQTFIGATYLYSMHYYEARPDDKVDQTQEFNLKIDHQFSERYKINFIDSFAYSSEPDIIQGAGTPTSTFVRTAQSNVRNRAGLEFTGQATELWSFNPGASMVWYNYLDETGPGSLNALLNRIQYLVHLDARYLVDPNLSALVGYQWGAFQYQSSEPISTTPGAPPGTSRDSMTQYGYVGADYAVSSQLNGYAKVGVQYTTYDQASSSDTWAPYADINGTYTYLPGSFVQIGVREVRNATDVSTALDQLSTLVYASVNHRLTKEITASLIGQYQRSVFNGGSDDGMVDNSYAFGINVEYRFNPNFAVNAGYNYDTLISEIPDRAFNRNRVFIGGIATF